MSREIEVTFSKRFTMGDDQPVRQAVQAWVESMGFSYISYREVTNEANVSDITLADCVDYILRGKKSKALSTWLHGSKAQSPVTVDAERSDQHDGAGAHWG